MEIVVCIYKISNCKGELNMKGRLIRKKDIGGLMKTSKQKVVWILCLLCLYLLSIDTILCQERVLFQDDFESGIGNWTIVNGTQTNQWHIGTATANGGTHSIYISDNGGLTNTYTASASVVHFYRDVTFPPNVTNITIRYSYKGTHTGNNLPSFNLVETTTAISAGSWVQLSWGAVISSANSWTTRTHNLSYMGNNVAGSTRRLVFSWRNNNTTGEQPPSAIDDIVITYVAPAQPLPIVSPFPVNNAINIPIDSALSWLPDLRGNAPTGYKIFFGTSNPPTTMTDVGYATSWTPEPAMLYGLRYFWRVVPYNDSGDATNCPVISFATSTTQATVPNPAIIVEPLNNANNVPISQILIWENGGANPTGYYVYFGTSDPPPLVTTLTSPTITTWSPSSLEHELQYFWRIIPFNTQGDALNCPVWNFTTISLVPPFIPEPALIVAPAHNSLNISTEQQLSWQNGGGNPTGYYVYFGASNPPLLVTTLTSPDITTWTPSSLEHELQYFWRIIPFNAQGNAINCPVWNFTTIPYVPPTIPEPALLLSPAHNSLNIPTKQQLNWQSGGGIPTGFKVFIGETNPPTQMIDVGSSTSWTPELKYGIRYYWKVVAYNSLGEAESSPVSVFTVESKELRRNFGCTGP